MTSRPDASAHSIHTTYGGRLSATTQEMLEFGAPCFKFVARDYTRTCVPVPGNGRSPTWTQGPCETCAQQISLLGGDAARFLSKHPPFSSSCWPLQNLCALQKVAMASTSKTTSQHTKASPMPLMI